MAPGGQGALVDVCDGKAHPQRLCGPRLGYNPPWWAELRPGGQPHGTSRTWRGGPQSAAAGAASETITPEGETEAQRG